MHCTLLWLLANRISRVKPGLYVIYYIRKSSIKLHTQIIPRKVGLKSQEKNDNTGSSRPVCPVFFVLIDYTTEKRKKKHTNKLFQKLMISAYNYLLQDFSLSPLCQAVDNISSFLILTICNILYKSMYSIGKWQSTTKWINGKIVGKNARAFRISNSESINLINIFHCCP